MKSDPISPVNVPGCFVRIQGTYASLRTAEQRVADFILKNPEDLIYLTVTELAERTQTSESTVVRLCQKIGYKGYQEFKIMLARDLVGPTETVYEQIDAERRPARAQSQSLPGERAGAQDTMEVLSDEELERAVSALATARRVEIYGIGGSAPARAGRVPQVHEARHRRRLADRQRSDGDVLGAARERATSRSASAIPVRAATSATRWRTRKTAGATTICITHRATSPITKVADVKLFTAAKETAFGSDAMSSRIAQLSIIDVLYAGIANKDYDRSLSRIQKTREASAGKRY